jgi:hypothetical protein
LVSGNAFEVGEVACEIVMLVGKELFALLGRETSNFAPPDVEAISVGCLA